MSQTPRRRRNPNYLYSVLSVALVLFLLGFFGLFLLHAPKWIKEYKEDVNVMVEIKEGTLEKGIKKLIDFLTKYIDLFNAEIGGKGSLINSALLYNAPKIAAFSKRVSLFIKSDFFDDLLVICNV